VVLEPRPGLRAGFNGAENLGLLERPQDSAHGLTGLNPEVALEIIESIPVFLARASQEAEAQGLAVVIQPLLDHAEEYFLQPMDLIPEMTQGLAGLLDDAYLVLRVLQNLEQGPKPFLDWDLDHPTAFIRGLVGEKVGRRLDVMSVGAMQEVSQGLSSYWRDGHQA